MVNVKGPDLFERWVAVEYANLSPEKQTARVQTEYADKHENSLAYAVYNFDAVLSDYLAGLFDDEEPNMNRILGTVIYGNGGLNRYYVYATGEVVFSVHHSSEESQARAKAQGFNLFL